MTPPPAVPAAPVFWNPFDARVHEEALVRGLRALCKIITADFRLRVVSGPQWLFDLNNNKLVYVRDDLWAHSTNHLLGLVCASIGQKLYGSQVIRPEVGNDAFFLLLRVIDEARTNAIMAEAYPGTPPLLQEAYAEGGRFRDHGHARNLAFTFLTRVMQLYVGGKTWDVAVDDEPAVVRALAYAVPHIENAIALPEIAGSWRTLPAPARAQAADHCRHQVQAHIWPLFCELLRADGANIDAPPQVPKRKRDAGSIGPPTQPPEATGPRSRASSFDSLFDSPRPKAMSKRGSVAGDSGSDDDSLFASPPPEAAAPEPGDADCQGSDDDAPSNALGRGSRSPQGTQKQRNTRNGPGNETSAPPAPGSSQNTNADVSSAQGARLSGSPMEHQGPGQDVRQPSDAQSPAAEARDAHPLTAGMRNNAPSSSSKLPVQPPSPRALFPADPLAPAWAQDDPTLQLAEMFRAAADALLGIDVHSLPDYDEAQLWGFIDDFNAAPSPGAYNNDVPDPQAQIDAALALNEHLRALEAAERAAAPVLSQAAQAPYAATCTRLRQSIDDLQHEIENALTQDAAPAVQGYTTSGIYDVRRGNQARLQKMATGRRDPRVFVRKQRPEQSSVAMVLCIDISGSMAGDRIERARDAFVVFQEVLAGLEIPYGAIAYNAEPTTLTRLGDDNLTTREQSFALLLSNLGGGTVESPALDLAQAMLDEADVTRKIIFVITDGQADGRTAAKVRSLAQDHGIEVTGIGIGPGCESVRNVYPRHVVVPGIDGLARDLGELMKEDILKDSSL